MKYIPAEKLIAEIERRKQIHKNNIENGFPDEANKITEDNDILYLIRTLRQEQPKMDLDYLKNKAELIANEIMIGVQANKYHTCVYNKTSNDFNHSHLVRAALKGIELGLNAGKEE